MPKISVVVASQNAGVRILRCLDAMTTACQGVDVEITVVDNSVDRTSQLIEQHFPEINLVRASEDKLIPQLWELGIRYTTGDLVAITTGDFVPQKDWAQRMLEAHQRPYAGIGGAVENDPHGGLVSWAIYFCRYSAYMLPLKEALVNDFAADNASYKRSTLDAYQAARRHGFWESSIHASMRADGRELLLTPTVVIYHQKSFSFLGFIKQRFLHGRQFGMDRAAQLSTPRRLLRIFTSPLIPLVFLYRITKRVVTKKRHLIWYFSALPALIVFLLSWSVGELIGYLSVPEDLSPRLAKRRI